MLACFAGCMDSFVTAELGEYAEYCCDPAQQSWGTTLSGCDATHNAQIGAAAGLAVHWGPDRNITTAVKERANNNNNHLISAPDL